MLIAVVASSRAVAAAQRGGIPTPESVFGFPIGKDSNLVDYEQSIDYFKKLAAASNRIHLINVGTTSFGRPWTAAIITSPENYAKLDHYRADQHAPGASRGTHRFGGARASRARAR